jgi:hypothetical protein
MASVIPLAKEFGSKVVSIVEIAAWLGSKGVDNTVGFNKGGTVDLGFVKLTMTHVLARFPFHRTRCLGESVAYFFY